MFLVLGDWPLFVQQLQSWLDQWAVLLSRVPPSVALGAILLPCALAIFSRQVVVVLVCVVLAAFAFCAYVDPSNATATAATGIYVISLITALFGIATRRKVSAFQTELVSLRQDVNHLLQTEERRLLSDLRSSTE
jgi:hypothetical protein